MSLHDRLVCLADFAEMIPFESFSATTTQMFAVVLEFILQLTTSAVSGARDCYARARDCSGAAAIFCSIKSAPSSFATWTTNLCQKVIADRQQLVQVHQIFFQAVDQNLYSTEALLDLKQPFCNVFSLK